jgi:hypothetical protein
MNGVVASGGLLAAKHGCNTSHQVKLFGLLACMYRTTYLVVCLIDV